MNDDDIALYRRLLGGKISDTQRQIDRLERRDQGAPDANRARRITGLLAQLDQLTDVLDRIDGEVE